MEALRSDQLSQLYNDAGDKVFPSVIVVTDRTVLDDQLQDTIYPFEHADDVVGRINRDEGQGSKSEKLAASLEGSQPIIIVTIQTFPFVLKAIENSTNLKERCYAVIADEAHSSQSGRTAGKLKEVLSTTSADEGEDEPSHEDKLNAAVEARKGSANLSYYAFTATPKSKTLELFGRLPNPNQPASKQNKPKAFHVYSMRQAIEEGYILDVLQNYTSYKVAYNLAQMVGKLDAEVDSKKAKVRLGQWVRLHDYNIAQKVKVIVEHYRQTVMGLLNGHEVTKGDGVQFKPKPKKGFTRGLAIQFHQSKKLQSAMQISTQRAAADGQQEQALLHRSRGGCGNAQDMP